MPELHNASDLLRVLGNVAHLVDPIAELQRQGFQFKGELKRALENAKPASTMSIAQRERLAKLVQKGKTTFHINKPKPIPLLSTVSGDYDIMVGVRLSLVDEVLRGLRQVNTIPQKLSLEQLLSPFELAAFSLALELLFKNFPKGSTVGNFRIREGISTKAIENRDALRVRLPFELELIDKKNNGKVVGSIKGQLSVVTRVSAKVIPPTATKTPEVVISLTFPKFSDTPPEQDVPLLEIDPDSQLQPNTLGEIALRFAFLLQNALAKLVHPTFEVIPPISIPKYPGVELPLNRLDVRVSNQVLGDMVAVGVHFSSAVGDTPDGKKLLDLQPDSGDNVVVRVRERFFQDVLTVAFVSGELEKIVQEEEKKAKLKSARIDLASGQIHLVIEGVVEDKCGVIVLGVDLAKDVDFIVNDTISFIQEGLTTRVDHNRDIDLPGVVDSVVCGLLSGVATIVLAIPAIWIKSLRENLLWEAFDILDPTIEGQDSIPLLVPLNTPLPRTVLLPFLKKFAAYLKDRAFFASFKLAFKLAPGVLLSYGDAGTFGNVSSPVVVGLGGWQEFRVLFTGKNLAGENRIYAIYAKDKGGRLLSYGDAGTPGNVSNPMNLGIGWQRFKFLFAGGNLAGENRIYAVDQAGQLLSYGDNGTPGNVTSSSPMVVGFGGWLAFKFLFAGRNVAGENRIYAVDQTGRLLSYGDAGTPGNVSSPVVVGLGGWKEFKFLFSGRNVAGENRIYAVDLNGRLLSYADAGTPGNVSSPVVVGLGGWLDFKFLFAGGNVAGENRIYAVVP